MTVKQLYDFAVKHGLKNAEIVINYTCGDCWYDFIGTVEKYNLRQGDKKLFINISDSDCEEEN